MTIHIQINQNPKLVHFNKIKIFVWVIPLKISGTLSATLTRGVFIQLSNAIFENENYFSGKYE